MQSANSTACLPLLPWGARAAAMWPQPSATPLFILPPKCWTPLPEGGEDKGKADRPLSPQTAAMPNRYRLSLLDKQEGPFRYTKRLLHGKKRAAAFEKMMAKRSSGKIICPDARCPGRTRQWCGRRRTCLLWQCSPDTCAASPSGRRRKH